MWKPVTKCTYFPLKPDAQALIVACPLQVSEFEIRRRWASRAVASVGDSSMFLRDVVVDLLANPQVRCIVFYGPACGREAYDAFWYGQTDPKWGITPDHLSLVKQFVDLYDDDFSTKGPQQPFWPQRIIGYTKETT